MASPSSMINSETQATSSKTMGMLFRRTIMKRYAAEAQDDQSISFRQALRFKYHFDFAPIPPHLVAASLLVPTQERLRTLIHDILSVDQKTTDHDKYMPRRQRLHAIAQQIVYGNLDPPDYYMGGSNKKAAWKHEVLKDYRYVEYQGQQLPDFALHCGLPGVYRFTAANRKAEAIFSKGKGKQPGPYYPLTPIEDSYNIILEHHVVDGRHRGRDATYGPISKFSSSITKELVADFCANCPGCENRVQASRVGHDKRKADGTQGCKKKVIADDNATNLTTGQTNAWLQDPPNIDLTQTLSLSHSRSYNDYGHLTSMTTPQPYATGHFSQPAQQPVFNNLTNNHTEMNSYAVQPMTWPGMQSYCNTFFPRQQFPPQQFTTHPSQSSTQSSDNEMDANDTNVFTLLSEYNRTHDTPTAVSGNEIATDMEMNLDTNMERTDDINWDDFIVEGVM